jgi:hypothetical protein
VPKEFKVLKVQKEIKVPKETLVLKVL